MTDPVRPKTCAVCGRRIEWRRKWARDWEHVRFCSAACRRRGVRPVDRDLEAAMTRLLDERPRGTAICPSEVARLVAGDRRDDDAQDLTEAARAAARRLVAAGEVEIVQGGRVVDPSRAKGAIRVRRRQGR